MQREIEATMFFQQGFEQKTEENDPIIQEKTDKY